MIRYRYNILIDFKQAWGTIKMYSWLKKNGLIFYLPTPMRFLKLWMNMPKSPNIHEEKDVVCYWTSSGTWGSYELPNKIFICPWNIDEREGGMEAVIKHEIVHLDHEDIVKNMNYDDKEEYIEKHGG